MKELYPIRVERGISFLRREYPEQFKQAVDRIDELSMGFCHYCFLGLGFGHYFTAKRQFIKDGHCTQNNEEEFLIELGFTTPLRVSMETTHNDFTNLTETWKRLILKGG